MSEVTEVTYLSGWQSELCIQLNTENNNKADFNRLLVKGSPSTKVLQLGFAFEDADRKKFILQLKKQFSEVINQGGSHRSLYSCFRTTCQYLDWCDKQNERAFTQNSIEGYLSHLDNKVMQGDIKSSSYKQEHSRLKILFTNYLELPHSYFDNVVIRDGSDSEPFEAYTRNDLNQLLPFLRQLFKQCYSQFIADPEKHINAGRHVATMVFNWQGQQYKLHSGISKMMCTATLLLAYYTYANTGELFKLKRPLNASMSLGEMWYTMPAFKRRAFKTIQVEMGDHELEIPKYALDFFNKLISASKRINNSDNTTLLQTAISKKTYPITSSLLGAFLTTWVEKYFTFTDQTGRRLRPVVSRFRETGAQLTAYYQGELANDVLLNNTPSTRNRYYSTGNKFSNIGMMQDAMVIREEQVKSNVSAKKAQENLNIEVLVIEKEHKVNIPNLSRTINGGSCGDPFGERSEKYTKQAHSRGLAREGERLACADLLACFGCPNQIIVQSVSDIWCLLSFKARIEESLYLHLDAGQYRRNFEYVIQFIEQKILTSINKKILKQAVTKLNDEGLHPAWNDSGAALMLIPPTTQRA